MPEVQQTVPVTLPSSLPKPPEIITLNEPSVLDSVQPLSSVTRRSRKGPDWRKEAERVKNGDIASYDIYMEKTRKMEERALRKQQQIEANRDNAAIDDIIEVNEMYIESLQGKLELLNQIEHFKS